MIAYKLMEHTNKMKPYMENKKNKALDVSKFIDNLNEEDYKRFIENKYTNNILISVLKVTMNKDIIGYAFLHDIIDQNFFPEEIVRFFKNNRSKSTRN